MLRALVLTVLCVSFAPATAGTRVVAPGPGALAEAVAGAASGDVLILAPGRHDGPVTLDRPLTLEGQPGALVEGDGTGSVLTITGQGR